MLLAGSAVVDIACSDHGTAGLSKAGAIYWWGRRQFGPPSSASPTQSSNEPSLYSQAVQKYTEYQEAGSPPRTGDHKTPDLHQEFNELTEFSHSVGHRLHGVGLWLSAQLCRQPALRFSQLPQLSYSNICWILHCVVF